MPTPTYTLIDSVTLASSAASVTFSSIDQSYGDLVLVTNWLSASGSTYNSVRFNGDSGTNYPRVWAMGNGSTATSGSPGAPTSIFAEADAQTSEKALATFQIMDYSATDKHKSVLLRSNRAGQLTNMTAARWANTSAITSIEVSAFTNSYATGSTFHLYGIAKAL